jgi:hypothetical protein
MKAAHYLGRHKGKKVYRFPVKVVLNDSRNHRTWGNEPEEWYQVTANTASDAVNYIRELYRFRPETEVFAYGPNGGETHRYIGWETCISAHLVAAVRRDEQLNLL